MTGRKTVLIVDDDAQICIALSALLEREGYRALTAADAHAGLALAEREAPDLVVLDLVMPEKNGLSILEKVRLRRGAGPRVLVITGLSGNKPREQAQRLGADDYLPKPFDLGRFLESVRRLCPLSGEPSPQQGK